MKKRILLFSLILVFVVTPAAAKDPLLTQGGDVIHGGPLNPSKAAGDTILIMGPWGSGAPYNGQFQDPEWAVAWNGWTHEDLSCSDQGRWTVSDYHADDLGLSPEQGNLAAWCGYPYVACDNDEEGGYGNMWHQVLEWRTTVADPGAPVPVDWDFYISRDTELNYDFIHIQYLDSNGTHELANLDGQAVNEHLAYSFSYLGGDFAGDLADEIILQIVFISDRSWSDEDCWGPSVGACQVDDISIRLDGIPTDFTDFTDGTLGEWLAFNVANCVGDFAALRDNLQDLDPCANNFSYQATFIDDGIVVPGTGGSPCISWCYGPGGFVVNTEGGLAGPEYYLNNAITSPVMSWPAATHEGTVLAFDVYTHEDLDGDAPGMNAAWSILSTASSDPADIVFSGFQTRNWLLDFNRPRYRRIVDDLTDLVVADRQFVQVRLMVKEYGYIWGYTGQDATPAPYFDNVRLSCYAITGPALSTQGWYLAQDVFPTIGAVDLDNLGTNSCRFDMAQSISPQEDLRNDPGDSIIVQIKAVRSGSIIFGDPQLRWRLKRNRLFDPYRTSAYGTAHEGVAYGWRAGDDNYAFDLPDENFLFPGDKLHYCIVAQDKIGGSDYGTTIMPADTTGFSEFDNPLAYAGDFTVRCLPTVAQTSPGVFETPGILFWNDQGRDFARERWLMALYQYFSTEGEVSGGYDIFETNSPSYGVGNGLGGRAASAVAIDNYNLILYSSGTEFQHTLGNGDFNSDPSDDIGLINTWLQTGNKGMFMTGDNLVYDLVENGGAQTAQFVTDYLGVQLVDQNLRPLIQNQAAPLVVITPDNPIFYVPQSWLAYGVCDLQHNLPAQNTFDAVTCTQVGYRLAEFTDLAGNPGTYPYSAATLGANPQGQGSEIISMPYDLSSVFADPNATDKAAAPMPTRVRILNAVILRFGATYPPYETGVNDVASAPAALIIQNQPNPFNPVTDLLFTMPAKGQLTLKIFNVRGELVRTLVDGMRPAGPGKERWDGTDNGGQAVAAGVYICEAQALGQVQTSKMVIVR